MGVTLRELVAVVAELRATSKKSAKLALLAGALRGLRGREAELLASYLVAVLPQGRIGLGWRALQEAAGAAETPAVGEPLMLLDVDSACDALASDSGPGSVERRRARLRALLGRAQPDERRLLCELLLGELRQGALDSLLLEALARATALPLAHVRRAAMFAPGVGVLARALLERGAAGLADFGLRLLSPVAPMLASPAEDVDAALARLGAGVFEYKLDGARVQVHKAGDEVRVFTRRLQEVSARLPELVEWARALDVAEVVLEGEALALRADGRPHPFQVSMRRLGRTRGVEALRAELPLSAFYFDCLYLAGEGSLLDAPWRERVQRLERVVAPAARLPRLITSQAAEAESFLRRALDEGHEGLMAKSPEAPYTAGQRGFHWLKLKAAHTLDLVVLAAEWGGGRRQGLLSNLHLGARDATGGPFVMLGKTFKGLSDELLRWQTEALLARETHRDGHVVHVRPELVVEVAWSDVQESPRYPGGLTLRFARLRRYRPDKRAAEADTLDAVRAHFERQRA